MRARTAGLVVLVSGLTACGTAVQVGTGPAPTRTGHPSRTRATVTKAPGPPSPSSVRAGRFVTPVELGGGALRVDPAPSGLRPSVPERRAATTIWAEPAFQGAGSTRVLGLGLATVRVPGSGHPGVRRLPAWVGFATAGVVSCPAVMARPTRSGPSSRDRPTTAGRPPGSSPMLPVTSRPTRRGVPHRDPLPGVPPADTGYQAVVLAASGHGPALLYQSGIPPCGGPAHAPTLTTATQVVSVPWRALGPVRHDQLRLEYRMPACGSFYGITVTADAKTRVAVVTVEVTEPDVATTCRSGRPRTVRTRIELGPPLGLVARLPLPLAEQPWRVRHGTVGPVRPPRGPVGSVVFHPAAGRALPLKRR